ncbi:MAG: acyl-CoA dehydrogenase family protein [Planctomycetes bacterium]|nr:acyl-CoA dehydrogenase family protein [Planctomycetota bacterium]MBI3844731.1 acyl-CoA dehydrogenase family protein [Planctomycetota bacterium]
MDFELDEDLTLLRDTARQFSEEELRPRADALDREHTFPIAEFRKAAELGFAGVLIPEEFGGTALGNVALSLLLIEINRACASTGVTVSVHNSLVCGPVTKFGSADVQKRYLPRLARGEILGAYALTEPNAGSDAGSLRTRAVRKGDYWVLDGTKVFVTSGDHAGLVIVYARTGDTGRTGDITAFLVEPSFPGFAIGRVEDKMGIRGSHCCEVILTECRVPVANVLGEVGHGFRIAMDTLDGGRIGIASQAIGIAQACLEESIKYAKERHQFGHPISDFQAIQWKLADMASRIEAARLLTLRAAWRRDRKEPHTQDSSMAKLQASTTCNFVAREAVQIHGGAGYLRDFPVERHFRDARITELYEGTTEVQRLVIARHLLK